MTTQTTGYRLACPGTAEYGRGLTARTVHVGGCCEKFAVAEPTEQERRGLRIPLAYDSLGGKP